MAATRHPLVPPAATPAVRAALDRLVIDGAHLIDLLTEVPEERLSAAPAGGASAREAVAAIVTSLRAEAERLAGPAAIAEVTVAELPAPELATAAMAARRAITQALSAPMGEAGRLPSGLIWDASQAAECVQLSGVIARGVLAFAAALPELLDDPLTLDWILFQRFPEDPEWTARRATLLATLRERTKAPKKRKLPKSRKTPTGLAKKG